MSLRFCTLLITVIACVIAVMLGWQISEGRIFSLDVTGTITAGALGLALCAVLVRVFGQPIDTIVLSALVFGYIVGNRGFAQLTPVPGVPLLPAETALIIAGGWGLISSAFARRLPWRHDTLNILVLLWLLFGTARVLFDVRQHGLIAIRDYAVVYYASFFFIAQRMAENALSRRLLVGTTVLGSVLVLPGIILTDTFPAFFLGQLTVHGAPLIYYKGDLGHIFICVGSLLLFFRMRGPHRAWAWPVSAAMFLFVISGNSRAAAVGLGAIMVLLLVTRHWQFPALQAATLVLALIATLFLGSVLHNDWAEKKLSSVADRAYSLADFRGARRYQSEESFNKGDNNLFRLVWWKNVMQDTWKTNPAFGLGFGHDLAQNFLREYFPEGTDEFTTRSPHNIFLTAFGRMGLVGTLIWGALCLVILRDTWGALHRADPMAWALWCSLWLIIIGASLGVVLEGPMGAVPFWTILGLAHQPAPENPEVDAADDT